MGRLVTLLAVAAFVSFLTETDGVPVATEKRGTGRVGAMERHVIRKRDTYVTFQDRAQATCIGMCMYTEKRPYSKCQNRCRIGSVDNLLKKQGRKKKPSADQF